MAQAPQVGSTYLLNGIQPVVVLQIEPQRQLAAVEDEQHFRARLACILGASPGEPMAVCPANVAIVSWAALQAPVEQEEEYEEPQAGAGSMEIGD